MLSTRRHHANRLNAARSTGPRTEAGKSRSCRNGLTHGLTTVSPVLPGEDPAAWAEFRDAVIDALQPMGAVERELVERVAQLHWRLRRVIAYEVAVAVCPPPPEPGQPLRLGYFDPRDLRSHRGELDMAERTLADARRRTALVDRLTNAGADERVPPDDAVFLLNHAASDVEFAREPEDLGRASDDRGADQPACDSADAGHPPVDEPGTGDDFDLVPEPLDGPAFLTGLGVPVEFLSEPARWDGWTAGVVRAGLTRLAALVGWSLDRLLAELRVTDFTFLERRVGERLAVVERLEAIERGRTAIPPDAALAAVLRYEPHLSRQVSQTLDQLERVRAMRRG